MVHRGTKHHAILQRKLRPNKDQFCGDDPIDDLLRARTAYGSGTIILVALTNAADFTDSLARIAQLTRAQTRFVLAASGHIAGMINPPSRGKGEHWTNDTLPPPTTTEDWLAGAEKRDGSWWSDWTKWLAARSGKRIQAPTVGSAAYPAVCDAPGSYVLEK